MSAENASRKNWGWGNKATREKRIESLRESWKDPEKKAYRISRSHSDEAESKRSDSLKIWAAENPEEANKRTEAAHKVLREKAETVMFTRLGNNPEETLKIDAANSLSSREIAKKYGLSLFTTQNYLNKFGIKLIRVTHLSSEETDRRKGIYYWANTFGLMEKLPNRYPQIMSSLYDNGREKIAMDTVGQEFNLTRERIRQIETRSLKILENVIDSMAF